MFAKCCNSECRKPFDHREGRLVRFSRSEPNGQLAENQRSIEHFWLCGKCAQLFVFEYDSEMNVRIKLRDPEPSKKSILFHSASAA